MSTPPELFPAFDRLLDDAVEVRWIHAPAVGFGPFDSTRQSGQEIAPPPGFSPLVVNAATPIAQVLAYG